MHDARPRHGRQRGVVGEGFQLGGDPFRQGGAGDLGNPESWAASATADGTPGRGEAPGAGPVLPVLQLARSPQGEWILRWEADETLRYRVENSPDLSAWTREGLPVIEGRSGAVEVRLPEGTRAYLRLAIEAAPAAAD